MDSLAPIDGHTCRLIRNLAIIVLESSSTLFVLRLKGQLLGVSLWCF
jgi:hypothetical protein